MRFYSVLIFACLLAGFAAPRGVRADEVYTFVIKKQEQKALSRWSLQEWLDTRDRMHLMDMWLALHTPTPYEFYLGGAWQLGSLSSGPSYSGFNFNAAAYASIFGLEYQRETGLDTRNTGLFHLRVFGYNYQSTHIRLEAGLRQEDTGGGVSFRNAVAGVGLVIYVARHFGIEGLYRHAFDSTPNSTAIAFNGDRYEGGAFIDFSFLQVYGKYLYESLNPEATNLLFGATRTGPQIGLKLFF